MKKSLLIIFVLISFFAKSQTPAGYTLINSRYDWLAGLFKSLGLPAGGTASFAAGQAQRAGAVYYDSTGANAGLYVWSGIAWIKADLTDGDKGDITVSGAGSVFTIDNSVVTYAKLQNVSGTNRFLGRSSAGAGVVEELTTTAATGILDVFTTIAQGVVPGSGGGTTKFLRADGSWQIPSGGSGTDSASFHNVAQIDDTTFALQRPNGTEDTVVISGAGAGGNLIVQNAGSGTQTWYDSGDTLYMKKIKNTTFISASTDTDSSLLASLSATGTPSATTFLRGDNVWATPAGSSYTFSTGLTEAAGTVTANLSTGISGGQTIIGGTASGNSLTYSSTSNATKGNHIWGTTSKMLFNEASNILQIGSATDLGAFNLQVAGQMVAGRGSLNPVSKFTYSNNTTGSTAIGLYTSTDVLQSLFRSNGPSIGTTTSGISKNNMTEVIGVAGSLFIFGSTTYIATNSTTPALTALVSGRIGLNAITAPTAWLHLPASTTAANTGSIKIPEGSRQITPEDGVVNYVENNLEFTETSTVYIIAKTLTNTGTLDFPSTAAGTSSDLTLTVTGAANGDAVSVGVPNVSTLTNGVFSAWVSAANTVTVRYSNNDLVTARDPASGTFRASVIKY